MRAWRSLLTAFHPQILLSLASGFTHLSDDLLRYFVQQPLRPYACKVIHPREGLHQLCPVDASALRITFMRGAISTQVKGRLTKSNDAETFYVVNAQAGDHMTGALNSSGADLEVIVPLVLAFISLLGSLRGALPLLLFLPLLLCRRAGADNRQVSVRQHRQRDVPVPARPTPHFILIKADFALSRFEAFFDRPPCPGDSRQLFQRCLVRP